MLFHRLFSLQKSTYKDGPPSVCFIRAPDSHTEKRYYILFRAASNRQLSWRFRPNPSAFSCMYDTPQVDYLELRGYQLIILISCNLIQCNNSANVL